MLDAARTPRQAETNSPPPPPPPPPPPSNAYSDLPVAGAQIGRYTNAQHYADGLFSEVFKAIDPGIAATDESVGQLVALKMTVPDMMTPPHDSKREARILQEARGDHIVPLLDSFQQSGGRFVLIFPFLPYGLDSLLQAGGLDVSTKRSILTDLFSGLAHLHQLGMIHRDIKPSNILLNSPRGSAYLTDFGIAWSPSDAASEPADDKILDVGTTCYRPPEVLFGYGAYGTSLDMWAAGCVAAQVVHLNSKTLFDAGDLGSELALIRSIFETLGTPDLDVWPEAAKFPDWGKMNFTRFPPKGWDAILQTSDSDALDLVRNLVIYESAQRLRAEEVSSLCPSIYMCVLITIGAATSISQAVRNCTRLRRSEPTTHTASHSECRTASGSG